MSRYKYECPNCKGTGSSWVVHYKDHKGENDSDYGFCRDCNGTGKLTKRQLLLLNRKVSEGGADED